MKTKIFLLFVTFILSACSQKALISNPYVKATPVSVPQKLADTPKDSRVRLEDQHGELRCYIPTSPETGKIYLSISTCNSSFAKPARYDVFGRIAYNFDDTYFCVSASEDVAMKRKSKDYAILTPCVINDKKQQWKVKDNIFMDNDETYTLKDDGAYVYVVNNLDKSFKTHKLHPSMKAWLNTVATPVNLSIVTSLAWDFTSKQGKQRYFIDDHSSSKNTTDLYYNFENGHLAIYDGYYHLNCMNSDIGGKDWEWVYWSRCSDSKTAGDNKASWKFTPIAYGEVLLTDSLGNALRVATSGDSWGAPYVVKPEFLAKDTSNNPTSNFIIDKDTQDFLRFISANIGDNLPFCPAPDFGVNSKVPLKNPPLPRDFNLNDAWRARLLAIVNTNDHSETTVGICGVCLLQSYQIIAELLENPSSPRSSGGYFFDTSDGANPFFSFATRNSLLYETLSNIIDWFPRFVPAGTQASEAMIFEHSNNLALMSTISMLPQYNWTIVARGSGRDVLNVIDRIFSSPRGSAFIVLMRLRADGGVSGSHAVVSLRTANGVVLIPTNVRMDMEEFEEYTRELEDRFDFIDGFESYGYTITSIALLNADAVYPNVFANTLSFNDCSGEGDDRRGSGGLPSSALVNQCASGRCLQ